MGLRLGEGFELLKVGWWFDFGEVDGIGTSGGCGGYVVLDE